MDESLIVRFLVGFLSDTAYLAGLPLVAATIAGLIISFLQAITQIQDQSLSQTIKIAVITFMLVAFGMTLVSPLVVRTEQLFTQFGYL